MDKAIDSITAPHFASKRTTSDPLETIGRTFAAEVMKPEMQLMIIMRECFSVYTTVLIFEEKKSETLRLAII